jgi:FkbM family methyltransferase
LIGEAGQNVLLYGAGNLGRRTLEGLRRVGAAPLAFVDASPAAQGSEIDGVTVLSPAAAAQKFGATAAFVVAVWSPSRPNAIAEISRALRDHGVRSISPFVPLFWRYAEEFLPYFSLDLPHHIFERAEAVQDAFAVFHDATSREQFLLQLSYLLSTMDSFDLPRKGAGGSYFPSDLVMLSSAEVFVDCGAYDGDSIASFLETTRSRFKSIIAFEPDPHAATRLTEFVARQPGEIQNRIRVHESAVGSAAGSMQFDGGGTPGSRESAVGTLTVERVTLDHVLREDVPTFIKMDIEGAEEDALLGATETIRAHRPILAVCVYHLQTDLYRLPTLISRLAPEYSLFLRRQGDDGDLVCFAVPNERLQPGLRT